MSVVKKMLTFLPFLTTQQQRREREMRRQQEREQRRREQEEKRRIEEMDRRRKEEEERRRAEDEKRRNDREQVSFKMIMFLQCIRRGCLKGPWPSNFCDGLGGLSLRIRRWNLQVVMRRDDTCQ